MLNISVSPSLWEVASGTLGWPHTTRPWIVATAVSNADGDGAHVQTMCAASGSELFALLRANDYLLMSVQCYLSDGERWSKRDVSEVLLGMLGEAAVAVFRDDHGVAFCPDAPDLPASHVSQLISVGCVVVSAGEQSRAPVASAGRRLHSEIRQASVGRRDLPVCPVSREAEAVRVRAGTAQMARQ